MVSLNQTIYRWSGASVVTGAILLTIGYWLRPCIEKELIDQFASDTALASSLLVAAGILLLLIGLPGLLVRQLTQTGPGSMVGAGMTFVGLAAFHLGTLALYFVLPVLVTHSAATRDLVYSDVPPFPRFALFWAFGLLIQVMGLIWLGIKTWQAKVYPRAAALLLIIGSVLLISAPALNFRLLQPATTLIMSGIVWCGITLLRQPAPADLKQVAIAE